MRTYVVFDCTTLSADRDVTLFGPRWLAHALAALRSRLTGRFHDFAPAGWGRAG